VLEHGQQILVAKAGRGGKGNAFFATATHQSPREWQPGEEGEERQVILELKLIADVGLVGAPNAGKSTLLSVVSAARPKIAAYPFTTLSPNLGVVPMSDHRSFVVADIPGIIEGASAGKGLGLQFLRHIERTRILAFVIPMDAMDWQAEYDQLRTEISTYSAELAALPHLVVFSKLDLMGEDDYVPEIEAPGAFATMSLSAANRTHLDRFLDTCWRKLLSMRHQNEAEQRASEQVLP
ncbi:MAG TPA: GTPase, partial [Gemmatimonadaceae bacterium]|nr:GTPase [Gemmatimonadaceae bacterium]